MSKSFDGNGSEESIKAALAEKLKLPMKKFMDSSGHVEEVPNLRQPEVDALAETDPDAAIVKADEIRREEALKDVKSTLKIPEREAAARAAASARGGGESVMSTSISSSAQARTSDRLPNLLESHRRITWSACLM